MVVPPGRETALRLAVGRAAPGLEPEDYLLATKDPVYGPGLVERQADGTYLVSGRLRSLARFGRHNLIHDPFPPPGEARFDLILCRNVLIYFEPALARQVTELLSNSLRPGGMVMLGAADVLQVS